MTDYTSSVTYSLSFPSVCNYSQTVRRLGGTNVGKGVGKTSEKAPVKRRGKRR